MADVEEDDPVVREMDVHINQALAKQLYLLQYPMRPYERGMPLPVEAKIKPVNSLLEVAHTIEQDGRNYDNNVPPSCALTSIVHKGTKVDAVTNYAIGVVQDGKFHLTPLHATLQMRPSFKHIDDAKAAEVEIDEDDEMNGKGPEEPHVIGFRKKESERATQARKNSYAYKHAIEEAESWIDLAVHSQDSLVANVAFESMSSKGSDRKIKFQEGPAAYLHGLNYLQHAKETELSLVGNNPETAIDVSNLPAHTEGTSSMGRGVDSLTAYLQKAVLISHTMLKEVSSVTNDEVIARTLQDCAVMVRGNWVLASKHLYPTQAHLAVARDATLLLLHRHGAVVRGQLQQQLGVSAGFLKQILEGVAELNTELRCWKPKLEDGVEYALQQADEARKWEGFWLHKAAIIEEELGVGALAVPKCKCGRTWQQKDANLEDELAMPVCKCKPIPTFASNVLSKGRENIEVLHYSPPPPAPPQAEAHNAEPAEEQGSAPSSAPTSGRGGKRSAAGGGGSQADTGAQPKPAPTFKPKRASKKRT